MGHLTVVALLTVLPVNTLIDEILVGMREEIKETGKSVLPVPDVREDWSWKHRFIRLSGKIECSGGWAGDLSTIKRTGDNELSVEGDYLRFKAKLGLDKVEFGFDRCHFDVSHILSATERIVATVDDFALDGRLSLKIDDSDNATLTLDSLTVERMGNIRIKTGGGVVHRVVDKLLDMLVKHFRERIVESLSKNLENAARKEVEKFDINRELKKLEL